jgi:hypothetical protein
MSADEELRINKAELENIIRATAHTTVQECQTSFMATLGININDSDDVKNFQATIRFSETLRIGSTKAGARFGMILVAGAAIATWEWVKGAIQATLHGGHP